MYLQLLANILIVCQIYVAFGLNSKLFKSRNERSTNEDIADSNKKTINIHHQHECSSNPNYIWCLPSNYTAEKSPFDHADLVPEKPLPWNYNFNFIVKGIDKTNDKSQSISIYMYFGVRWFDPRLIINETAKAWSEVKVGPQDEVTISSKNLDNLWYPELEIYGIESFRIYKVLKEMSGLRIRKDRTINYELKVEVARVFIPDWKLLLIRQNNTMRFQFDSRQYKTKEHPTFCYINTAIWPIRTLCRAIWPTWWAGDITAAFGIAII